MNHHPINKGNWDRVKGQLRELYHELNDNDLTYFEGHEDQMVGRLKQKLGKTEEEIRQLLEQS